MEFLEKTYTHCVFAANAGVKGAKVGFTNQKNETHYGRNSKR